MCAKQRMQVNDPWKPSSRSSRLLTSVLLLNALSAVNANICKSDHNCQQNITDTCVWPAPCHGCHIMQAFRHSTHKISACMGLRCSVMKLWTPDSLRDMAHSLNKVQDERLHVAFFYPMHCCSNKWNDLRESPTIETNVYFPRISLQGWLG